MIMDRLLITLLCSAWIVVFASGLYFDVPADHAERDWFETGQQELRDALKIKYNNNVAKNVILFLGDGMGLTSIWASRVYSGQYKNGQSGEEYEFEFEKFPHVALSKTYNVDFQIPDSAGTATAFLCGVKANGATVGVNHKVKRSNCSNEAENSVDSILDWSKQAGKRTGIVTTTRITHATPAAAYAHSSERYWENDAEMDKEREGVTPAYNKQFGCKDIARQLIEDNSDINVILGGGRRNFRPTDAADEEYPSKFYDRTDGRDLIQEWETTKESSGKSHAFVWNKEQFDAVDVTNTEYLFGLFEPSHLQYEMERDQEKEPSLEDLVRKAIGILQQDDNGFFLLVEGGRIDHAHHSGNARLALEETYAMDQAVKVAREMTDQEDTLIVVTADHSHSFTTAGYTSRGLDILGFADNLELQPVLDDLPYTTLVYANGPGAVNGAQRANLTGVNTQDKDYKQQALVPMTDETHGGEDVPIYASGPLAYLFQNVHEQNYIAHVMAYASCVGENTEHCDDALPPNKATMNTYIVYLIFLTQLVILINH